MSLYKVPKGILHEMEMIRSNFLRELLIRRGRSRRFPEDRWVCDLSGDGEFRVKEVRSKLDYIFLPSSDAPTSMVSEYISHVLFWCNMAGHIFCLLCRWWDLEWQAVCSFSEWNDWNQLIFYASPPRQSVVFDDIVSQSFKMVYRGKTCWVRAIEVPRWLSDFKDDCDDDDFESNDGTQVAEGPGKSVGKCSDLEGESDSEAIPETRFEDKPMDKFDDINSIPHSKTQSEDPFGVYELLNKKKKVTNNEGESQNSPTYPPGFTPNDIAKDNINTSNVEPVERGHNGDKEEGEFVVSHNQDRNDTDVDANESTCSGHFKKSNGPRTGGSIIQLIEDLVNVRQTMGYDMMGCMKNMENIIESQGVAVVIDEFSLPQYTRPSPKGQTSLDFNEVRDSSERFGLMFNKHGAKLFNDFIAKSGLTEVPLGGCIFTWCHKTASKMSKLDRFLVSDSLLCNCPRISSVTLDRYLSDHRPILLHESIYDYGPIPFKFYQYWFEIDGFDKLVNDPWNEIHVVDNNAYVRFMKKLKLLKERIKAWNSSYRELTNYRKNTLKSELTNLDSVLDRGEGIDTDVTRRFDVVHILQDIEKTEAMERNNLAIRGVLVDGNWVESPQLVKNEFYAHFKQRFEKPNLSGIQFDREFPNKICSEQVVDLEREVSKEEVKRAVWDCGIDKAPGLDGFTFGFYRRFWNLIECDVVKAVKWFFLHERIPSGGDSSFITLIPKVSNANMVKDFRTISLIGSVYKIVAKILANHLVLVLGDLVSDTQSAFLKERKILDRPFILNE
nr:RNA-directed DNA polymerase, eukaryota [Tanacetum cinerariifolium]